MSQEIEIEFKNMLTKQEFKNIASALQLTEKDFTDQKNHYFDTDSFALKQKHAALRIRRKNGKYVLTLKEPADVGLLETHQQLSEVSDLAGFSVPEGPVKDQLHKLALFTNYMLCNSCLKRLGASENKGSLMLQAILGLLSRCKLHLR